MNLFLIIVMMKYDPSPMLFIYAWVLMGYVLRWINPLIEDK